MNVLSLIKDASLCLLAFASMYVFGAIMFGWPFIEYLTPKHDTDTSVVITAIPLPKPDKPKRDSRLSVCVDETGKRVSCSDEIIVEHNDPNDYSIPPLTEEDFESPMPELDSVDDVTLTPEQEEHAIEQAREEEKHTKLPSKPKTPVLTEKEIEALEEARIHLNEHN